MNFERTPLNGVVIVTGTPQYDDRGYFVRVFCEDEFKREGMNTQFPQTSLSFNRRAGTVRGMHYQAPPYAETKLVRCSRGAVFDVLVDLRPSEATYRKWFGFELSSANRAAIYIPPGIAHGFQTLVDESELYYAITPPFQPGAGRGVRWDDPEIEVRWPLPISSISEKDTKWPLLSGEKL